MPIPSFPSARDRNYFIVACLLSVLVLAGVGGSYYLSATQNQRNESSEAGAGTVSNEGLVSLGVAFETGRGARKDEARAAEFYRRAADLGVAAGMVRLAHMYEDGRGGLPKDDAPAAQWYRKAAEAGNTNGMVNLGVMYANGKGGLPQDYAQAVGWVRRGADAGDGYAMYLMGYFHETGKGVAKNEAEAVRWYRKSSNAGQRKATEALARLGK
jgi:TPR repeat protein